MALILGAAVVVVGNDYRFTQTAVQIPVAGGHLEGVLTTPREGAASGLVVMVHGDAAVEATQGGLYSPWFEGAADAGYATLSWSKPGVGGSTGNWLDQSMGDRATEVGTAIDWALSRPDIPTTRIVLWGASQAGWVFPKVVAERDDIGAVVAVGTAIDWLSQGRFNLLAELDHEGATASDREQALAQSDLLRGLLERGASYEEYLVATTEETPMSADRWAFVTRNLHADATDDLRIAATQNIPIFLMAGEHDRNVDVAETERVYRDIFGSDLTVEHFDSAHSMARSIVEDNTLIGTTVGIFWPRALFAPDVIESYTRFLRSVE